MNQKELEARLAPLGKRSQYELIRALYIWVSYGVQVQFSRACSALGKRTFAELHDRLQPQYVEKDEQSKEKLMKNANIPVSFETLCRNLQNIVEIDNTLSNSTNSTPSSDKERGKEKEALPPTPSISKKKEKGQKENSGIADVIERAPAGEEHDDDDDNPPAQVLDKDVQDFMNYWNAQDQRMFVPCQYLNGVQTAFLKKIAGTKGMGFIKKGIDLCANAAYFQNSVRWGYKVDCGFFLDDNNFSKIINHRYDTIHKKFDKYQQAVEDNRRNALNDLQRATREALESDEGLLGKL